MRKSIFFTKIKPIANQIYQYNSYVTDYVEKSKEGSKGLFIGKLVICPPMIII